jgi:hypothetical protein
LVSIHGSVMMNGMLAASPLWDLNGRLFQALSRGIIL